MHHVQRIERHGPLIRVLRELSSNAISNFFAQYRHDAYLVSRKAAKAQRPPKHNNPFFEQELTEEAEHH
jgi:hypothetical protein